MSVPRSADNPTGTAADEAANTPVAQPAPTPAHGTAPHGPLPTLMVAALGVVFGDIGTSPLYAFKETLAPEHGVPFDTGAVLGILSLIFWGLIFVVTLKYIVFVLRADHDGEGGILALQALARRAVSGLPHRHALHVLVAGAGLVGAGMFFGDSLITPAISVLSAVEGLQVQAHSLKPWVIPITLGILVGLFSVQRWGTQAVGRVFGPVMVLWFGLLALSGGWQIALRPQILVALEPVHALRFLLHHQAQALPVLGAVFLAFTGGEALYADMGHFGARPIRLAWLAIALPALVLNYFGQGALVLGDPSAIDNPFFRLFPAWALLPMVALAAAATVIASQAVISGAFSITAQSMRLGYLPRMRLVQTSDAAIGQVYVPLINWLLLAGVLLLVLGFKTSGALSSAYGIAVSITMVTTTLLAGIVAVRLWHWNRWLVRTGVFLFAGVDLCFVFANSLKIADGGWLTLAVAAVALVIFTTWSKGRRIGLARVARESMPLADFVASLALDMPHRVDGAAVFLNSDSTLVPHALLHNLKHNQVLHAQVIVMRVMSCDTPRVDEAHRLDARDLGHGIWSVDVRHGFMELPDVPAYVEALARHCGLEIEPMRTSYFVSRAALGRDGPAELGKLRAALFGAMQRNAGRASDYFNLPGNRLVEIGHLT